MSDNAAMTLGGEMSMAEKRRRQRQITPVDLRRSANDWIQLIEEAKSKEQAWKFMREQMNEYTPFDSES